MAIPSHVRSPPVDPLADPRATGDLESPATAGDAPQSEAGGAATAGGALEAPQSAPVSPAGEPNAAPALPGEATERDAPTTPRPAPAWEVFATAALTTAVVTALSHLVPKHAPTLVGLAFLGVTWLFVLRRDETTIRAYGLSLGGLLEPVSLDSRRLGRETRSALGWVLVLMALTFPPFWFGYRMYWHITAPFVLKLPPDLLDDIAGQVLVTALPEEAFFRGYLQTALDGTWPPRWRILGATLGPGWIISAAIFAVGHVLTIYDPSRLAVFFPALLFGWMRAKTGGIGAGMIFHAACNMFSATLARGYGPFR